MKYSKSFYLAEVNRNNITYFINGDGELVEEIDESCFHKSLSSLTDKYNEIKDKAIFPEINVIYKKVNAVYSW